MLGRQCISFPRNRVALKLLSHSENEINSDIVLNEATDGIHESIDDKFFDQLLCVSLKKK